MQTARLSKTPRWRDYLLSPTHPVGVSIPGSSSRSAFLLSTGSTSAPRCSTSHRSAKRTRAKRARSDSSSKFVLTFVDLQVARLTS